MNLPVRKSVRITRAGIYLKPALVQVAHAAVKSKILLTTESSMIAFVKEEARKAIIAIARMMFTAIYHMLSTGEAFNPSDLYKLYATRNAGKTEEKAIKQASKLLISNGMSKATDTSVA